MKQPWLSTRVFRGIFWAIWFVFTPFAIALFLVGVLTPGIDATTPPNWIQIFVRDQPVPVGIVLFSTAEMVLWGLRNRLPLVAHAYPPPRGDIPPDLREKYEKAKSLLDEAKLILRKNERSILRALSENARSTVDAALTRLDAVLATQPFDVEEFRAAGSQAESAIDAHLGRWRKSEGREFLESIVVAVSVAMALRLFVIEAFKIPSSSMVPTLQVGDHIFVNKFVYGPAIPFTQSRAWTSMPPKRGDVIVFAYPEKPDDDFIKRVIALPGDKLEARASHPWINGWEVPHCLVGPYSYAENGTKHEGDLYLFVEFLGGEAFLTNYDRSQGHEYEGPFFVKSGEIWVMGDNRNNSHDSRSWWGGRGGGVPYENIRGRALFVWLSISEHGIDWSRLGAFIMGHPRVPQANKELEPAIAKCLRERPPTDKTFPPPDSR